MDKEKIMYLCQQIGSVAMRNKYHYPALHSDFDFINDAQMDIFREVTAPPKSNGDRIRQMTDEELAKVIDSYAICSKCAYRLVPSCGAKCIDGHLKWLKQEVKTDDER